MKIVRVRVDEKKPGEWPKGRHRSYRLGATTENQINRQKAHDDLDALKDAARYARAVRLKLGLTQEEFSKRIEVPLETIRNWEQGKRCPTGAARTLLRIINQDPRNALRALLLP